MCALDLQRAKDRLWWLTTSSARPCFLVLVLVRNIAHHVPMSVVARSRCSQVWPSTDSTSTALLPMKNLHPCHARHKMIVARLRAFGAFIWRWTSDRLSYPYSASDCFHQTP